MDASDRTDTAEVLRPEWFAAFLADRGTRQPSAHTMKAYRQDFDAIATLVTGDAAGATRLSLSDPAQWLAQSIAAQSIAAQSDSGAYSRPSKSVRGTTGAGFQYGLEPRVIRHGDVSPGMRREGGAVAERGSHGDGTA